MAKHLLLGTASENWRLHVSEAPGDVSQRILNATPGSYVSVNVVANDQLEAQVIWVNPSALGWWAILEFPDADDDSSGATS